MKKFMSLIICLSVFFSAFTIVASAEEEIVLNVYNWGEYIEQSTIDMFEEKYPYIDVNYTTFDSNESMYSKIVSGAASYDIVIPSEYMVSKLIQEEMLAELDYSNIPNYKYIGEAYKNLSSDPENKYSVPYFWGTVVVIYNSAHVDEADVADKSLSLLWNEKYADKILMFDNPRDSFGIALTKLGYSMNSDTDSQWQEAAKLLSEQKPIVQAYVMDAIFDKMESGEAWIAPYYAGDALVIQETNPDIQFYMPTEGTNMFVDSMCILNTTEHQKEAELFINFMCDPKIAAMNAETVGYATPNTEALNLLDPEITENELIYPDEEYLKNNTEVFINLPQKTQMLQSTLWTDLKIISAEEGAETAAIDWIDAFCIVTIAAGGITAVYFFIRNTKRKKLWKQ
ncbi:MAG: spermidine/putrescine ABC transporter substrate-binding protein [Clostridia bacterium]|nr:spermidine/putrescine ABC transporter substrate-binding protein [Clostridia bacterium]